MECASALALSSSGESNACSATRNLKTVPVQSFRLAFCTRRIILLAQMSAARKTGEELRITKELVVTNKLGIHARPAAMFVKTANRFECDVYVEKDGERVNGKSIMGLMMLAAGPGSKLLVFAEGEDAAKAVVELEGLLRRKFDED
jgi:phosphocarrier protein HPr